LLSNVFVVVGQVEKFMEHQMYLFFVCTGSAERFAFVWWGDRSSTVRFDISAPGRPSSPVIAVIDPMTELHSDDGSSDSSLSQKDFLYPAPLFGCRCPTRGWPSPDYLEAIAVLGLFHGHHADDRTVAQLFCDQLEFANVIVMQS